MTTPERQLNLDKVFLEMAFVQAKASRCGRGQVGSILLNAKGRLRSGGFNGHPQRTVLDHVCLRDGIPSGEKQEIRCCEHSEVNCLTFADVEDADGGTLYCSFPPCPICASVILQAGIARLVIPDRSDYPNWGLEYIEKMIGGDKKRLEIIRLDATGFSGVTPPRRCTGISCIDLQEEGRLDPNEDNAPHVFD